jgi:nitrate/nitrite transport system substrate-binding protein
MRRWGQISEDKSDKWYKDLAAQVYRPDLYEKAAKSLIADGLASSGEFPNFEGESGFRKPQKHFIDNIMYDGTKPNDYINKFTIGLKKGDVL